MIMLGELYGRKVEIVGVSKLKDSNAKGANGYVECYPIIFFRTSIMQRTLYEVFYLERLTLILWDTKIILVR